MNSLEHFALRWLQTQLSEILPSELPAEQAFPARLPLSELPRQPTMRTLYAALRRRGVELPPLFLSRTQHLAIASVPICGLLFVAMRIFQAVPEPRDLGDFFGAALCCFLSWIVLVVLAKNFLAWISSADTVGELAQQLFWQNAMFFRRLAGIPLSHEQIKRIVIRVLADTTGVDIDEITEDTRLVELTE